MTAAHEQNYHHPVNHNDRVKRLIRKYNAKLGKAKAERQLLLDKEDAGEKLCFADDAQCSSLFIQILDLSDTVLQLEALILPEEN